MKIYRTVIIVIIFSLIFTGCGLVKPLEVKSIDDALAKIKAEVEKLRPREWVQGSGWDEGKLAELRYIYAEDLDRVAQMGMTFTRGYATCQVCSPSRASILTGKYPTTHGITTWIGDAAGKAWRAFPITFLGA